MASWYYIQKLIETNPDQIYDFGCGWNIHKKYLPIIVGVGPDEAEGRYFADQEDYVDEDYIKYHQSFFSSAMSICALNDLPLSKIRLLVESFISMVKPGGRGYIALDLDQMFNKEDSNIDRKSTRLNSSHIPLSRMPSSA